MTDDSQFRTPFQHPDAETVLLAARRAAAADRLAAEAERTTEDPQGAALAAALLEAAGAASRAVAWVCELAARTSSPRLAEFAVALLACGRDLDPTDAETGGVPDYLTERLDGLIALQDGLTDGEAYALATVGAIARALPRTIPHTDDPARHLPELARHLDRATATGRAARP
ncbi:hypothetical protein ACIRD3_04605 [Kitasatospora sp. NPDC093550]|uniref:hypothetical protein n=1 Tax=Kitasatospora sp. NPDC093550 TaxID=3364089 RepID=UPI00382F3AD4